ncbi:hypothetical protein QN360_06165 [Glaciimonas sp. CA11.2]|uniref:hypothetical protein n=1 Tax=Glaciimonas sp. CA11.2 TaxID=3048601 RepID=UPI002AB38829|nr:hypothetical protein [Glaciimonas sp. CA11.2]MDY7547178.1 hypothetical protein [Glaciimonas sp. CA11.2]MEB0162489.1 hypothetical protein [Glaciimonas sp. CA11.2]
MKLSHKLVLSMIAMSGVMATLAHADEPGRHASYIHALQDLDTANWLIAHRGGDNWVMGHNEQVALTEINAAKNLVVQSGRDVGKDFQSAQRPDIHRDHNGRLHDAVEALSKARQDVTQEEDDPRIRGMQHEAVRHIDIALHATKDAIRDAGY